ncbi:alpha/beta hydrolase, partial [Aliivibrio sifiae]
MIITRTLILLFISLLSGCSNFLNLSNEIEAINSLTNQYTITLSEPVVGSAVIIEQITDISESDIDGYDAIIGGSSIALQMSNEIHYLLLFEDKNKDLTLQSDEAFSVIRLKDYQDKDTIKVTLRVNEEDVPQAFVNCSLTSLLNIEIDLVEIGTVVS